MAMSTVADEKAKYKSQLIAWFQSILGRYSYICLLAEEICDIRAIVTNFFCP